MGIKDKIEIIRSVTRAIGFLLPVLTICVALFVIQDIQDIAIGAVVGSAATAGIFYYKNNEKVE